MQIPLQTQQQLARLVAMPPQQQSAAQPTGVPFEFDGRGDASDPIGGVESPGPFGADARSCGGKITTQSALPRMALPVWGCEYECGFFGLFDLCSAHEEVCPLRD
jgi:hypothetical protein